jgi:aminoglycoside phosphotransferase (APT) family kinase protein
VPPTDASPPAVDPVVARAVAEAGAGEVRRATRLTGGASRETWRCVVDAGEVVAQRQRPGVEHDMAVEASVLHAATAADVAVPPLLGYLPDIDGSSVLVTRQVDGETIARRILRDDSFAVARERLVEQLGRTAARIHRIDPSSVAGLDESDMLTRYREQLDELGEPHPTFELAFRWLEEHRPPSRRRTVVHGDLRLGNVIVDRGGLAAVIDWELAHVGDPMEDLGWLCVPAWRFGAPMPAAGLGSRRQLLEAYNDEAGTDVDLDALRWWEIAGILKWGIICVAQAHKHLSGEVRSHELAAIGRRVCENEHDLFLALEGRW